MEIGGINPVYRPIAAQEVARPIAQPSPDSAATDLASTAVVPKSVSAGTTEDRRGDSSDSGGGDLDRRVIIDPDTQDIVFQSVDDVTQSVVRQYPDQAMLRRKAYFVKLDEHQRTTAETETSTAVERRV